MSKKQLKDKIVEILLQYPVGKHITPSEFATQILLEVVEERNEIDWELYQIVKKWFKERIIITIKNCGHKFENKEDEDNFGKGAWKMAKINLDKDIQSWQDKLKSAKK